MTTKSDIVICSIKTYPVNSHAFTWWTQRGNYLALMCTKLFSRVFFTDFRASRVI